ncbi:LysE family translocator [Stutzerimonas stutzeri]|uniref:LysE family translocator n=1 Tax=Stutzerimonas stutzeri TaxID=316 RepID=UPI0021090BF1|nr:LysE family translocator [Stutzerimonas stutzeri]MCQ4260066.1 LysE family translocator [Stutzerimonas stutzeri]
MSQLLPFFLFVLVASITPGPTNMLVLSNSARFGWRAALPLIFGACASAAAIVLLVGLGLGELLMRAPTVQQIMAWLGVGWISWLAWKLWCSADTSLDSASPAMRIGAWGGAGLQLINPKTWMMALAVVSVFAGADAGLAGYGIFALIFLLVAIPCLIVWAAIGRGAVSLLRSNAALRRFNQVMALLLLVSAWSSLLM